jgi:hypothetical protein
MSALIPFPTRHDGLPPHRDRLRKHMGELGGLGNERARRWRLTSRASWSNTRTPARK